MDNDQNSISNTSEVSDSSSGVSFPSIGQPKRSSPAKTLLILGIILLVGVLGYIIFKNFSTTDENQNLVPVATQEPILTPEATATPSPKPVDKSKVKIEVQNGTGITGEAAYLQEELKKIGYTTITVGNASNQNQTKTTVTYARSLTSSLSEEITTKLKELYKEVDVKTSSTATTDVTIVTGLKKGATGKPSATTTPKSSATGTPKASGSPTASASSTPSSTP